jgi:hypothetical protein
MGAEIQAAATVGAPGYGQNFAEADWDRIAERLEALAQLLWEVSQHEAEAAARAEQSDGS